jgi:putative membrane protein
MSHPGHRRSGAIDVIRLLPFTARPRPTLADRAKDLLRKKDDAE